MSSANLQPQPAFSWIEGWEARAALTTAPFPIDALRSELPSLRSYKQFLPHYPTRYMLEPPPTPFQPATTWLESALRRFCAECEIPPATRYQHLLVHDLPGYAIGPHPDAAARQATAILYLAPPNSQACGTTLFVNQSGNNTRGHRSSEDGFLEAYTAPYTPGTVLIFETHQHSWHGVRPTSEPRDTLMVIAWSR